MLNGKTSLITGGSLGIGLAVAHALAREGCNLIICGRDKERLERAQKELSATGVQVTAFVCDVREAASVRKMFDAVGQKFKNLDVLVNSAGIANPMRSTAELPPEEWNDVLATNLTGTFLVCQAALRLMKRGSSIVNILSMSSKRVFPNLAAYNASKFGALGFTNTLREELRGQGIRVIAALPGSTDTPIWDTLWPDAPRDRMLKAETVAEAIVSALKLPPESTVEELAIMPTGGPL